MQDSIAPWSGLYRHQQYLFSGALNILRGGSMKRLFKIVLGTVGAVILLLVVAAIVLPLVYDTEDLKQAIATQLNKQTGRELRIDGDLDFSVFPWLAVEVNDLSISNAPGFGEQPFASIETARMGVALMPLFKKQLVADEVVLTGLRLDLAVNADGLSNWDDLAAGASTKAPAVDSADPFASRQIAGLNIRDAQIEFQDQQAGSHYRISGFSMQTGALGIAAPVPVELSMALEDLAAGSRMDISLSAVTVLDLKLESYTFNDLELEIQEGDGQAISLQAPHAQANLAAQTFSMDAFTAQLSGLQVEGGLKASNILDAPAFSGTLRVAEFSPAKLMQAMAMEAPVTADPSVLQSARLSTVFDGNSSQLALSDFELDLDQSRITGMLNIRNFDQPGILFDLDIDSIDIDRYLEPAADESAETTDVAIPQDELQDLDIQGTLRVAALRLADLDLTDAVIGLTVVDKKLQLNPLTAGFYGGTYSGNIALDASLPKPRITLDEKVESIDFQRLVADLVDNESISGTAFGHIKVRGRGHSSSEVLGTLKGNLGLTLDEGALEGINVWYEIRRALAKYKGLPAPEEEENRTVFARMKLAGKVENGVLTTRELIGELPFLTVQGNGTIDLGQLKLDLGLVAAVRNVPELVQDPLAADLKGRSVPFRVSGALDKPKISVDWEELLKGEAKDRLLKELGLGASSKDAAGGDPADSDDDDLEKTAISLLDGFLRSKEEEKDEDSDDDG